MNAPWLPNHCTNEMADRSEGASSGISATSLNVPLNHAGRQVRVSAYAQTKAVGTEIITTTEATQIEFHAARSRLGVWK